MENEFVINIGTVNGSGSQSANLILMRSLFNMGIPVGGKNVFPSNIAGLPTWFWIRASEQGYTGRRANADIVVAMNTQTMTADMKSLKAGGVFIYNSDLGQIAEVPGASQVIGIPFKTLVDEVTDQIKVKKMVINIIYVGVLIQLLGIDEAKADAALVHQLGGKQSVLDINRKGLQRGIQYVRENLEVNVFPFKAKMSNKTAGKMLIDGNSSAALGAVMGGCTFASWYPITPASSLMEEFIRISNHYRVNEEGRSTAAIVQAEDELAAICMVLGAGWAGARAMTATSGPGLSLMQEAAGYAYYTEIPAVVWDVQRTGPSTGMPTRTMQGDLLSAHLASHGDTQFPMLIPGNPTECFTMAQDALDLAERLQTLVFVMSDLDIGMNLWMVDRFQYPEKPYDRGKVLSPEMLKQATNYERYGNPDGDGIPWRSLPGNAAGAYTIRGSGHNRKAAYTELSDEYREIVDRLTQKYQQAVKFVPPSIVSNMGHAFGIVTYGSTDAVMSEVKGLLGQSSGPKVEFDSLRIRSVPFGQEVKEFIDQHEKIFVIDQNRDGQMHKILQLNFPNEFSKMVSIVHYDGTPITADFVAQALMKHLV